jgi:hypothetical protein
LLAALGRRKLGQIPVGGPAASGRGVDRLIDTAPVKAHVRADHPWDRRRPQGSGGVCQRLAAFLNFLDAPARGVREWLVEFELGVAEDLLLALKELIGKLRVPGGECEVAERVPEPLEDLVWVVPTLGQLRLPWARMRG